MRDMTEVMAAMTTMRKKAKLTILPTKPMESKTWGRMMKMRPTPRLLLRRLGSKWATAGKMARPASRATTVSKRQIITVEFTMLMPLPV
mgnify:CR=1 FL=1